MQIPREIYDCWKAVADKFKFLHQGTDDERREATKRGVQTIRARFRGQSGVLDGTKWIAKSQHNTGWSAQSKDALAFVEDGPAVTGRYARMSMFDMINGSSRETNPYPVTAHNHEETPPNDSAYCLVPEDYDWLEDGTVPQPPVDSTHMYDGGGNDTGKCDICGQERFADVHKIPASFSPHTYNGGEQDTGLCDICQKPLQDPLHSGVSPVPPDDALVARVEDLEGQVAVLEARVTQLENQADGGGVSEARVRELIAEALAPLGVEVASNGGFLGHSHKAVITGK
jgi:hypothetical protein